MTSYETGRAAPTDQSLGELVAGVSETLSRLMRQEVALARAETRAEITNASRGIGALAGAGAFALVTLIVGSLAIAQGLTRWMDIGWALALVAAVWAVVALILMSYGRRRLHDVTPIPDRTARTLREVPDAMRGTGQ